MHFELDIEIGLMSVSAHSRRAGGRSLLTERFFGKIIFIVENRLTCVGMNSRAFKACDAQLFKRNLSGVLKGLDDKGKGIA